MNVAVTDPVLAADEVAEPGLISPCLTPYNADLTIDTGLYIAHAQQMLGDGCVALAPFGTTGEALSVGIEERIATLEALVAAGVPTKRIVPGTGLTNLPDTVRLTKTAMEAGCAGAMILPPFYFKNPPDDGLYAYFARLIEMVGRDDLRICLYHIPQVAGVGFPVSVVERLRRDFPDQVVAIKDSTGDPESLEALMQIDGLTVYPGSEALVVAGMERGGPGCISAMSNINAPALVATIAAFRSGEEDKARRMHLAACRFRDTIVPYVPIVAVKRLLALQSGIENWAVVRPPMVELSEEKGRELQAKLDALG